MSLAELRNADMGTGTYSQVTMRMDMLPDPIWNRMKTFQNFTIQDIVTISPDGSENVVRDYIRRCIKGGYVSKIKGVRSPDQSEMYCLVNRDDVAPFLDHEGKESHSSLMRENIWRTIKIKKIFTAHQLFFFLQVDENQLCEDQVKKSEVVPTQINIQRYLNALEDAGFIELEHVERGIYAVVGHRVIGPEAPILMSCDFLYDSRKSKVVSPEPIAEEVYL